MPKRIKYVIIKRVPTLCIDSVGKIHTLVRKLRKKNNQSLKVLKAVVCLLSVFFSAAPIEAYATVSSVVSGNGGGSPDNFIYGIIAWIVIAAVLIVVVAVLFSRRNDAKKNITSAQYYAAEEIRRKYPKRLLSDEYYEQLYNKNRKRE